MHSHPLSVMHIASGDLWAGAEVQLATLARAQSNLPGVSVTVLLMNHGRLARELIQSNIEVIVLDESKFNGFSILKRITQIMRQTRPDVVHTHRIKENVLGSIAARLAGNIPCLRTAHGAAEHPPSWRKPAQWLNLWLDNACARWLQTRTIAVSRDLADQLRVSLPAGKIVTIENGIDLEACARINPSKPDGKRHIGLVGRLVAVKRCDVFIDTARLLFAQSPQADVVFHIFGDGPLQPDLEQQGQSLITTGQLVFEGHSDEILQHISRLDILLMTSDHEGLPMTLLEAMALETPIVAHAVGGIPRLLADGACGNLVSQQDPVQYASLIRQVLDSPEQTAEQTRQAAQRVAEHYSAQHNAKKIVACYQQILDRD